jgi:HD-GYP domain-containing protein (c-di-GMP phosphodiesterase class II)
VGQSLFVRETYGPLGTGTPPLTGCSGADRDGRPDLTSEAMSFPEAGLKAATPSDEELPGIHEQLVVFARELGALYRLERSRSAELEIVLENLQQTYIATMKSLAQVIEAKDRTTRGHLERTQAYGLALTRRIDGDLVQSPTLGYGFFLHDIGKVGIPEHILCKTGPLDVAEWDIMRSHPVIGAQIVAPMAFLTTTVELIRHHHERFDGSGYPDGLRGDDIPLSARIFAVADSFDAMTSDRPYRGSIGIERALAEIRGGSGTQFDPEVVRVFVDMIEQGADPDEPELAAALGYAC